MNSFQVTFVEDETARERATVVKVVNAFTARDAITQVADGAQVAGWRFSRTESGAVVLRQSPEEGHAAYTARRCYPTRLYRVNGSSELWDLVFDPADFKQLAETALEHEERIDLYDGKRIIDRYACEQRRRVFQLPVVS